MTRRIIRALAIGLMMLCGACTLLGGGMGVEYDEQLSQQLRDLSGRGGTAKLADLTDFTWDTVHVFGEGATASEIEQAAGEPVLNDKRYYDAGNLLVFVDDGHVVAALSVLPDLLVTDGQPTWNADTILEPRGQNRPSALQLVKPR